MKKKRLLSLLLTGALCLSLSAPALAAGLENFQKTNTYTAGQFTDVPAGEWYAANVQSAYELGLMEGSSATTFNPSGNLTIAEALVLACRLHSTYVGDGATFTGSGGAWYQPYVDYAVETAILSPGTYSDYTATATRAQFASILAAALPAEALTAINSVTALPDVAADAAYAPAVLSLYNAGVLTGSDAAGSFKPDTTIQRSEVATIVTRMADPSLRKTFTLTPAETQEEQTVSSDKRFSNPITAEDLEGTWSATYFDGSIYEYTFSGNQFRRVVEHEFSSLGYTSYTVYEGTYTMTSVPMDGNEDTRRLTLNVTYQETAGDDAKGFSDVGSDSRTMEFTTDLNWPQDAFMWSGAMFYRSEPDVYDRYLLATGAVGERKPTDPDPAVYQYLVNYVKTNGSIVTYGDYAGQYEYVLDPYHNLKGNWNFYLYYDSGADIITLAGSRNWKLEGEDYDSYDLLFINEYALTLTPELTTPFAFTYEGSGSLMHTGYGVETVATADIDPFTFKNSTEAMTFTSYTATVEDGRERDEENCADGLQLMLSALEGYALVPGGYTLTDLGFDQFYA